MRRVIKGDCPDHLLRKQIEGPLEKVFSKAKGINTKAIKSKVYRGLVGPTGAVVSRTVRELAKRYFGKCAYCESFAEIEIEHYRPKASVEDVPGHPGYYWLCYEWTNLLPACHDCNEVIHGKGAQFPIFNAANRRSAPLPDPAGGLLDWSANAIDSPYLTAEAPVLLHPEYDFPEQCLAFKIESATQRVTMFGTDALKRGEETIRICNLKRDSLLTNRTKDVSLHACVLIENLLVFALPLGGAVPALQIAFQQLDTEARNEKLTYTLLRQYVVSTPVRFESLVASLLPAPSQSLVITEFEKYRAAHPSPYTFAGI